MHQLHGNQVLCSIPAIWNCQGAELCFSIFVVHLLDWIVDLFALPSGTLGDSSRLCALSRNAGVLSERGSGNPDMQVQVQPQLHIVVQSYVYLQTTHAQSCSSSRFKSLASLCSGGQDERPGGQGKGHLWVRCGKLQASEHQTPAQCACFYRLLRDCSQDTIGLVASSMCPP